MKSVALPIYTADLGHMEVLLKTPEDVQREQVRTNLPDLHPRSVVVFCGNLTTCVFLGSGRQKRGKGEEEEQQEQESDSQPCKGQGGKGGGEGE